MSAGGRALAEALGGFGAQVQNMAETVAKVDAQNEATQIELSLSDQIEQFNRDLLLDPNPGMPGSQTPEGYMAKWEKFSQGLQEQASKAKNPLAKKEVTQYVGKVIPSQGTKVAQIQLANWGEQQKVSRRNAVLKFAMTSDPQSALDFASQQYGELLGNTLTASEYDALMREAAAPILEKALFDSAVAAFDKGGEEAAAQALMSQMIFNTSDGTYEVSDQIRDTVSKRLNIYIQQKYAAERNHLGTLQSNTYAELAGQKRYDENGNPLPTLTLDDIDKSSLPEEEKKPLRTWYYTTYKERQAGEMTDAEKELWEKLDITHRINTNQPVSDEERSRALTEADISALVKTGGITVEQAAAWKGFLQNEQTLAKTNQIEAQRTQVDNAVSALRRAAYSSDGAPVSPEDAAAIGLLSDTWIDSFSLIPAQERAAAKDNLARLNKIRADRLDTLSTSAAENAVTDLFGQLSWAAAGLDYDKSKLPTAQQISDAIAKVDPTRQAAYKQEATRLLTAIAKNEQEENNSSAFWDLATKANTYITTGSGLSEEDITKAVNDKKITTSQASYLLGQLSQADSVTQAKNEAARKGEEALRRYDAASEAYRNLQKLNNGEKLPEGAQVLSTEFIRTLGMDANELQYWDAVLEKTEANRKQLDAIKSQSARETLLAKALANAYKAAKAGTTVAVYGESAGLEPILSVDFVEKVFEGVEDPEGHRTWLTVAQQIEQQQANVATNKENEDWRARVRKADDASVRKANGEDVGDAELLSQELIDAAPKGITEDEKTTVSKRITAIEGVAAKVEAEKGVQNFYTLLGNTTRLIGGEPMPKGTHILTFEEIWNNPYITGEMKISADSLLRKAIGAPASGPSEADKNAALDTIEAGAKILQRIKNGDTKNTVWTFYKDGQLNKIDLSKNGEAEWNRVVGIMTPLLSGHYADIEDYRGYFSGQAPKNPRHDMVDDVIAQYEKTHKTTLSSTVRQQLKDWGYNQADMHPEYDNSKFTSVIEQAVGAKSIGFNFQKGLDLDLTTKNNAEDFVYWVSEGKAQDYMGVTEGGIPKPVHPAVTTVMEQFAGKFREAMTIIPNGNKLTFGPQGNAVEYWGADGQRWVTVTPKMAGKQSAELFKALGYSADPQYVLSLQFYLGIVDGQARIMKRTNLTSGGSYDQVLYNKEWKSVKPTSMPYVFASYPDINVGSTPGVKGPKDEGFIPPNSYYPGLW